MKTIKSIRKKRKGFYGRDNKVDGLEKIIGGMRINRLRKRECEITFIDDFNSSLGNNTKLQVGTHQLNLAKNGLEDQGHR